MRTDFELLDRWREGDNAAGNELFARHFDSVCRFFETKLSSDVEELVQETFLACVRHGRDQFRKQSSFRTYLFTIARHEFYRYLRERPRGRAVDVNVTSLADLQTTPTSRLARDERQQLLLRALRSLPIEQQVLLELHYWQDLSPTELAEVFEIPQVTARTRLFRARQALREHLERLAAAPASASAPPSLYQSIESLDAWARALRAEWDQEAQAEPDEGEPT